MRYMIGVALIAASGAASAQQEPWQEYDKFIKSAQVIKAEGPQLFGDSVNLYTGATTFAATDVSLPGNSGLPVAIGRSFTNTADDYRNFPFGEWDWDIPRISGTFSTAAGWQLIDHNGYPTQARCSAPLSGSSGSPVSVRLDPTDPNNHETVGADEYWSGFQLTGQGGKQEVLVATADSKPKPADGRAYPWVTKQFWYLSCLPSLKSGQPGEGFLAHAPDGTRYYFDWMVSREVEGLLKPFFAGGQVVQRQLDRSELRIYPTRVEDRFGNWVEYQWDGAKLMSIVASDGRRLNITWGTYLQWPRVTKIATTTAPVREWVYGYDLINLSTVTLPDQGRWEINLSGITGPSAYDETEEISEDHRWIKRQDKALSCSWMRVLLPLSRPATIKHPSGAMGEFQFQAIRHGRTFVPPDCVPPPAMGGDIPPVQPGDQIYSRIPARFDVLALRSKKISGPGLPGSGYEWTYEYTTPIGGWLGLCANCETTKTTTVNGPGGERTIHTYGVVFNENEGQLLKAEFFQSGALLSSSQTTYLSNAAASNQAFSDRIGQNPQSRLDSLSSERLRPALGASVAQDGVIFSKSIISFDAFANPIKTVEHSSLGFSRTDSIERHHDLVAWVLGQLSRRTNEDSGAVVSQTDYDAASALPLRTYAFGKFQQSFAYHPDATLASVTDGRNLTTRLDEWKRGRPQWVRFHDGSQERIVVDDNGWVTAVTDETGATTQYGYDSMGRMNRITPPAGDDTAWSQTAMAFAQVNSDEYGLAPGHWRQVITAGNYKKIVYFDALWRPVAEQEEDISNAADTLRWSAKRYDHDGRTVFASYPHNPITEGFSEFSNPALKGTHSFYDVLGRPTRSVQDSENGQLTSTVQYLTGFKRRSTNARGIVSEESFQVFGEPSYERPVQIDAAVGRPERARTTIERDVFGEVKAITRGSAP